MEESETILKIKETEEQGKAGIEQARHKKEQTISHARSRAAELIEKTKAEIEAYRPAEIRKEEEKLQKEKEKILSENQKAIERLRKRAEAKLDSALQMLIEDIKSDVLK